MKYIKTYESHKLGIDSEIKDILSDITDDGKFTINIKSDFAGRYKSTIDENDFVVNIYEREDKLFTWGEVKDPIQMLIDNLKDRYPIMSVDVYLKGIHGSIQLKKDDKDQLIFDTQEEKVIRRVSCMFIK